jgi:hypothetical protein
VTLGNEVGDCFSDAAGRGNDRAAASPHEKSFGHLRRAEQDPVEADHGARFSRRLGLLLRSNQLVTFAKIALSAKDAALDARD